MASVDTNEIDVPELAKRIQKQKLRITGPGGPTVTVKTTTGAPATTEPAGSICVNIVDFKLYVSGGAGAWGIVTSATPS